MGGSNSVEVFKTAVNKVTTEGLYKNVINNSQSTKIDQLVDISGAGNIVIGDIGLTQSSKRAITSLTKEAFSMASMNSFMDSLTSAVKESAGNSASSNTNTLKSTVTNAFNTHVDVQNIKTTINEFLQKQEVMIRGQKDITIRSISLTQNFSEIKKIVESNIAESKFSSVLAQQLGIVADMKTSGPLEVLLKGISSVVGQVTSVFTSFAKTLGMGVNGIIIAVVTIVIVISALMLYTLKSIFGGGGGNEYDQRQYATPRYMRPAL